MVSARTLLVLAKARWSEAAALCCVGEPHASYQYHRAMREYWRMVVAVTSARLYREDRSWWKRQAAQSKSEYEAYSILMMG